MMVIPIFMKNESDNFSLPLTLKTFKGNFRDQIYNVKWYLFIACLLPNMCFTLTKPTP